MGKGNSHGGILLVSLSHPQDPALRHASAHPSEDSWGEGHEGAACGGRAGVHTRRGMGAKMGMRPLRAMGDTEQGLSGFRTGPAGV